LTGSSGDKIGESVNDVSLPVVGYPERSV